MENPVLLRRHNPYCVRTMAFCQTRACAAMLSVLSQRLLTPVAAKQKPQSLTPGWSAEQGIMMEFDQQEGANA